MTFSWSREGQILPTNSESHKSQGFSDTEKQKQKDLSEKYWVEATQQLDLVTFQSVLVINEVQSTDYGAYECLARNELGFDAITIQLNRTSKPDPPLALRVINITSASVQLRWIPGFDGGLGQDFRVRYRPTASSDPTFSYRDVFPTNSTQILITGLNEDTEYIFGVQAINEKGQSDYTQDVVKAQTLKGIHDLHKQIFFKL